MSATQEQTEELKEDQALARLCVVSFIQLVGVSLTFFLIKYGPRAFGLTDEADWQRDCLSIAYVLGATIILLFLTFIFTYLLRLNPGIPEGIILLTFGVNIIAFSLAMARTGGPSQSFFGQLVPMQLSGILILEQQKAITTSQQSSKRRLAWLYAGFTILAWLTVVLFPWQVAWLWGWQQMTIEARLKSYEDFAATVLFILGMVVTAFAYWVTPRLAASFRRRKQTQVV